MMNGGIPLDYKGTENFLLLSDTVAIIPLYQGCGDPGINKPYCTAGCIKVLCTVFLLYLSLFRYV